MSACLPCDLEQQSPTFLVPGLSFWEDNFSTDWGWVGGWADGWLTGWVGRWADGWVAGRGKRVVGWAEGVHV